MEDRKKLMEAKFLLLEVLATLDPHRHQYIVARINDYLDELYETEVNSAVQIQKS